MSFENQDTIYNDNLRKKAQKKQKKSSRKIKLYHSFMTIVLFFCVIQLGVSTTLNITKLVDYSGKITKARELKAEALNKNKQLKSHLENLNSMQTVASIARNSLKMAGENEVLVIINTPDKEEVKPKTKKELFIEFFEKNIADKILQNKDTHENFVLQ